MAFRLLSLSVIKDGTDPGGAALALKPERKAAKNIVLEMMKLKC